MDYTSQRDHSSIYIPGIYETFWQIFCHYFTLELYLPWSPFMLLLWLCLMRARNIFIKSLYRATATFTIYEVAPFIIFKSFHVSGSSFLLLSVYSGSLPSKHKLRRKRKGCGCGGVPGGGGSVQLLSIQLNFPLDSSSSRLKPTTEQNSELGIKRRRGNRKK